MANKFACGSHYYNWAHGVEVSHPLRMRKALGSNLSVSIGIDNVSSARDLSNVSLSFAAHAI